MKARIHIKGMTVRIRLLLASALAMMVVSTGLTAVVHARPGDLIGPEAVSPACPVPANHDPAVIDVVYAVGKRLTVNDKVLLAAFEAGWVESHMNNLACGDLDSLGVFQQRPSQGWGTPEQIMNVEYAAGEFYERAIPNDRNNPQFTAGQLAQSVQRSAFPDRYDQAEGKARQLIAEARSRYRGHDRDYSGDGFGDLVTVSPDGYLDYYRNNASSNPGGVPFTHVSHRSPGATWGGVPAISGGDVSGDGSADLMVVSEDSYLDYYPNNAATNPGGNPFAGASHRSPAPTWGDTKFLGVGDISGDGAADMMVVAGDGYLYYYPNNAATNPGGHPFSSARYRSQQPTWGGATTFTVGDLNGDGFADILVVGADGYLYGYYNNGQANNGQDPFHGAAWRSVEPSWSGVQSISATDISGDGSADLLMIDSDNYLYYYPNNAATNPGGRPFASSQWRSETPTWGGAKLA